MALLQPEQHCCAVEVLHGYALRFCASIFRERLRVSQIQQ